jgi:filamentous hemagglutinin
LIKDLYKGLGTPAPIGSGSTADAIRHERITGTPVGGKWHTQKGQEYSAALRNWLGKNSGASQTDKTAAQSVLEDLLNALSGK